MVKLLGLSLSLCFLLFSGCFAFRQQPEKNDCQFNRINPLKPDNRIESEAGLIETWNPTSKQFRCAGVAFSRCTLQRNGLRRPFYSNSPQEIFIQQGSGYFGMIFPGCPSTYEEPQESQRERGQRQSVRDRHQKVHRFSEGDVIAVPTGVAFWMFNDQETPVVAVSVIDTNSMHNQLDQIPRRFYLAGNQENEFLQYVEEQGSRRSQIGLRRERQQSRRERQQSRREGQQGQEEEEEEDENENGNVLSGFSPEFLQQAFQVNRELVRNLQGKNEEEDKGAIVKVKGELGIISPPMRQQRQHGRQEREEEDEDEDEDEYGQEEERQRRRPHHGGGGRRGRRDRDNGLEETLCTVRLRSNIGQRASPDIYNPEAGRVRAVNDLDFPILRWLGLSAEYGSLNRNAMFVPHYNLNANSILYALNGRAHIQIVDCSGNTLFDGELEEGHVLTIPQNFVVAAKSLSEHFRYVAFKTNARPSIATLAGGSSLINSMPEEVVAQSFGLRREQARQLKNNNPFKFLVPPQSQQQRAVA